jgi:hypothetical protein
MPSTSRFTGDDGMNIPTLYADIEAISADRLTLTVGKDGTVGTNLYTFAPGSPVIFFNRSTLVQIGTGVVLSVSDPGTVVLQTPLPVGVSLYDLMNNADGYADYVEVTDSVFRDSLGRGALLKSSNVYCARNVFDHNTGPGIKTETDGCFWFEGHPVTNWTVTNNTFIGWCASFCVRGCMCLNVCMDRVLCPRWHVCVWKGIVQATFGFAALHFLSCWHLTFLRFVLSYWILSFLCASAAAFVLSAHVCTPAVTTRDQRCLETSRLTITSLRSMLECLQPRA